MSHNKTIQIDCDGVLADFTGALLSGLYVKYGVKFVPEQVTCFEFSKCLPGITDDHVRTVVCEANWCSSLPALPYVDALPELRKMGKVICVTSPFTDSPFWLRERIIWLEQFGFNKKEIVFSSNKNLVIGDLLIDDAEHNVSASDKHCVLVNSPWNQFDEFAKSSEKRRIYRVSSVGGLVNAAQLLLDLA